MGLLQAVAGAAVIAAAVLAWQQLETDRGQLRQQLAAVDQDQAGERFARALDQLGSEQLDVRLGGVYGLERIAARAAAGEGGTGPGSWSSEDRLQVFEILSAYVRAHSHRPPVEQIAKPTLQARQADIQAAASVLARRTVLPGDPPLDLYASLLPGARLTSARLAGADLDHADLRGADLRWADLSGARLGRVLLCGTQLRGADLRGATLEGAMASARTDWPAGFDWKAAGVRQVDACSN
jgi:pentapeptide repeat protein